MCALLLALLALSLPAATGALAMTVPARRTACVYFDVPRSQETVFGSYQVASGGFLDIDLEVKSPGGTIAYTAQRKTNEKFKFVATESGEYSACFGNTMSTMSSKQVAFNFRVGKGFGTNDDLATKADLKPIEARVLKLAEEFLEVQETQRYSNSRERAHRDTTESTNDRVKWFSVGEFVVLILTNAWQIYALKQFFEKRTRM